MHARARIAPLSWPDPEPLLACWLPATLAGTGVAPAPATHFEFRSSMAILNAATPSPVVLGSVHLQEISVYPGAGATWNFHFVISQIGHRGAIAGRGGVGKEVHGTGMDR